MAADGRGALLARVVDHLSASGFTDLSLRALAADIGTSHRMLIYHFGSHDGLVEAVVSDVEERQRTYLRQMADTSNLTLAELAMAFWTRVSATELQPLERLFFGLYARLLQQGELERAGALVQGWLDPVVALLVERGIPRAEARKLARLGLAVTRGLLLDLLATGDRRAVDAAMRAHVSALYGSGSFVPYGTPSGNDRGSALAADKPRVVGARGTAPPRARGR